MTRHRLCVCINTSKFTGDGNIELRLDYWVFYTI